MKIHTDNITQVFVWRCDTCGIDRTQVFCPFNWLEVIFKCYYRKNKIYNFCSSKCCIEFLGRGTYISEQILGDQK